MEADTQHLHIGHLPRGSGEIVGLFLRHKGQTTSPRVKVECEGREVEKSFYAGLTLSMSRQMLPCSSTLGW